ncbi:MAG: hypothetical protein IKE33_01350 [Erysipelotrichaceae bacterium]|nr:hypothetical protein [Erysipelotrichaceae bacterium]
MKKGILTVIGAMLVLALGGCGTPTEDTVSEQTDREAEKESEDKENALMTLKMMIDDTEVEVEWEDNEAVKVLGEICTEGPLTIEMSMYGGFEQVGSIGTGLPRNDVQTTTAAGDIVLYSGNQLVIFYGSNSWSYTRLGKITDKDKDELKDLLGNGDVTVTIERQ